MNMRKFYILILAVLSVVNSVQAKNRYGNKKYNVAVQITNPLSAQSKIGGFVEGRVNRTSFVVGYTDYIGAYAGNQEKLEFLHYFKTPFKNEWFWYAKVLHGDAAYDSKKLTTIQDNSNVQFSSINYNGFGAGFGRRLNLHHFNITINLGVKYCNFSDDIDDPNRKYYNLFFATGPGSYVDFNFRFGYQF